MNSVEDRKRVADRLARAEWALQEAFARWDGSPESRTRMIAARNEMAEARRETEQAQVGRLVGDVVQQQILRLHVGSGVFNRP